MPELAGGANAPKAHRPVFINDAEEPVAVYDRPALAAGQTMAAPVIIEERETTIFIRPGWTASVAENGCITATRA